MKVIGYQHKTLNFKDGNSIEGYFLYLDTNNPNVVGIETERIFLSDKKADGYHPQLEDEIKVFYNRYGKVDSVLLVS